MSNWKRASRNDITAAYVRSILDYDSASGQFRWREREERRAHWNERYAGTTAGAVTNQGYLTISINNIRYKAHRLAWLWMTGEWPTHEIDHRDLDKSNNSFDNLRLATKSQNGANRLKHSNNTSGFKGIYWNKRKKKWIVSITQNGIQIHLGYFDKDDLDGAKTIYASAAKELYGDFARVNDYE